MICTYFFLFNKMLFFILLVSFSVQKILALCNPTFLVVAFAFGVKSKKKKIIAKTDVKVLTAYVFFQFYGFRSYVQIFHLLWVNFCVWCKIVIQFCSFACSGSDLPIPFIKETILSLLCQYSLGLFAIISWSYICEFVSGLSVLHHWPKCLFLCKYFTILITVAL